MEAARFEYHPIKMPVLSWAEFRTAVAAGQSVEVHGFTLGRNAHEAKQLESFRGYRFKGRVRFQECVFQTFVDFSEAVFEQTLHLVECKIKAGIYLMDTVIKGRCSMRGSTFWDNERHWLNWRGLKTGRGLHLIGATAHAPIDLYQALIGGDLHMSGLQALEASRTHDAVWRNKHLTGIEKHHVAEEMPGKAINLDGARINGDIHASTFASRRSAADQTSSPLPSIRPVRVLGTLNLCGNIGGDVRFGPALIGSDSATIALDLDYATVAGSVLFGHGVVVAGSIHLRASITGHLVFDNTTIVTTSDDLAVDLESATIGGSIAFGVNTIAFGGIDLRAEVHGDVRFSGATLHSGPDDVATVMDACTINGSVVFNEGTQVSGRIVVRARIGRDIIFDDLTVNAGLGVLAIDMEAAQVGGSVSFCNGTRVIGWINLRATVGEQVAFEDATILSGPDSTAINMQSSSVGKTFFLTGDTIVGGDLDLFQASLHGGFSTTTNINLRHFDRYRGRANDNRVIRKCLIVGDLDLRFAKCGQFMPLHGLSVLGTIKARHLHVAGDLHLCAGVAGTPDEEHGTLVHHWLAIENQGVRLASRLGQRIARGTHNHATTARRFQRVKDAVERLSEQMDAQEDELGWQAWDLNSTPEDSRQIAIDLELAHVRGHLWVRGQRVLGCINASQAHIEGDVNFDRALIEGDLVLRDARINGAFSAEPAAPREPGPLVLGVVDARGATIEAVTLDLGLQDGVCWVAPRDYLFDAATVGSFLAKGRLHGKAPVRFSMHRLQFSELELEGLQTDSFPWFSWRDWLRFVGGVALLLSVAGALAWASLPDGWRPVLGIAGIYVIALSGLTKLDWMAREKRKTKDEKRTRRPVLDFLDAARFSAAFHMDVERWARAAGDDPRADEVFLKRRRRELRERRPENDRDGRPERVGEKPSFRRIVWLWRWIVLDVMFGYGVRPARAIHLFFVLWLLNWAIFLPAAAVERPLSFETQAVEVGSAPDPATPAWLGDGGAPGEDDHWGPQRAFFMAMRVQVPPVELFVDAEWKPADRPMFAGGGHEGGVPLTYENYAAIMRILNLILVPVIIAGATGLLKPREAQYTGAS